MIYIASISILLSCALSSSVYASVVNTPQDLFKVFESTRLVFESKKDYSPYRLYLSELKKINGQWQVESQKTVIGKQRNITLELESFLSFEEALKQLSTATKKLNGSKLYGCQSYDCGRSNGWANHYFKIKQLYGLDARQAYQVWRADNNDSSKVAYWVLYLVERGNKRIYFQANYISDVDMVKGDSQAFSDNIKNNGFTVFDGLVKDSQGWGLLEESVQGLASLLSNNPELMIRLVGHDYRQGTLEVQKKRSLGYADKLKQQLIAMGVDDHRIKVFGLGSLAPAGKNREARIEIIVEP